MIRLFHSEKFPLFAYFILLISAGTALLSLPGAWKGSTPLAGIDALFTATSAVCVTGLITVDTAQYSSFGQGVILFLIQSGGLGILTFTTLYLVFPQNRISLRHRKLILNFYIEGTEPNPFLIVRKILAATFLIEAAGTVLLFTQFHNQDRALFVSLFHAVSAFCNAGFSTFSTSLEDYSRNIPVLLTAVFLIFSGGISFYVIHDVFTKASRRDPSGGRLSFHSRIVLNTTAVFIILGTLIYFFLERENTLASLGFPQQLMNALFWSVTPRTAGFNALPVEQLTTGSQLLTLLFMFVGGAPGSIAGGVKISTFFLVALIVVIGVDDKGEIRVGKRKLGAKVLSHATMFMLKAVLLLLLSISALSQTEGELIGQGNFGFLALVFEAVSAFGTVGLSHGITPLLSSGGKMIIIATMFAGRLGLVTMALTAPSRKGKELIDYPHGEVLLG